MFSIPLACTSRDGKTWLQPTGMAGDVRLSLPTTALLPSLLALGKECIDDDDALPVSIYSSASSEHDPSVVADIVPEMSQRDPSNLNFL